MGGCFSRDVVAEPDDVIDPVLAMRSAELTDDIVDEFVRAHVSQLASLAISLVMEDIYQARRADDSDASDDDV